MRALMRDDLRTYITNREGGVDEVGADEYIRRVEAMDPPSAEFTVTVTQAVAPRPDMAIRHGRDQCRPEMAIRHGRDQCRPRQADLAQLRGALPVRQGWARERLVDGRGAARGERRVLVLVMLLTRDGTRGRTAARRSATAPRARR